MVSRAAKQHCLPHAREKGYIRNRSPKGTDASMAQEYALINGAMAPFFTPNTIVPPATDGPIPQTPIGNQQTFQLIVAGVNSVSATIQVIVSNDRVNWTNYFDPFTVSGTSKVSAGFGGSQNWKYFSAYLTAISGTAASATLLMNG